VEASDDPAQAVIAIPAIAVAAGDSGESHVWVVDQGTMTVQKRAVTTGELIGTDRIQINGGLESGEVIATSAVSRLREGMAIRKMDE
jgi:multidrug efflux pump subunit AcrA (membrane-fusion protein)